MKTRTISPLVLSATCQNLGGTGSAFLANDMRGITDDIQRLQNPSRTPWLLDEIRFLLFNVTSTNTVALAGQIGVKLDLGRMALTAGRYIPIAMLTRPLDYMLEVPGQLIADLPPVPTGQRARLTQAFTWRLPKPLYLPAGETVVPAFRIDDSVLLTFAARQWTIFIAYAGRVLPADAPIPDYVYAPFATAWVDQARAGGTDVLAVRSIRSDLKNPFAEDLYVQRMVGSYIFQNAAAQAPLMPGYSTTGIMGGEPVDRVGQDYVTARIFKSDGSMVVRHPVPWNHIFHLPVRSFELCSVLKRNEFYQVQSDIRLSPLAATTTTQLMASLIGYRKVAYARGSGFVEAA